MKAIKTGIKELSQKKDFPGLISADFKWEVDKCTVNAEYKGPVIDPEVWQDVLAFMQFSYDTTHSEAQARLYVNVREGRWGAWVFPQQCGTGMTTEELKRAESPEEAAARFDYWGSTPSDDWMYFGTVHHHCSMSAFQSGTDEANEQGQDGLHITLGAMDKLVLDMDCRFYLNQTKFEPDMADFWDIGQELTALLPWDMHGRVAKHQMSQKVVNREFPKEWKLNLIEKKVWTPAGGRTGSYRYDGGLGYTGGHSDWLPGVEEPLQKRAEIAMTRIKQSLVQRDIELSVEELEKVFERWTEPAVAAMLRIMSTMKVDAEDMLRYGLPSLIKKIEGKAPKQLPQGNPADQDGHGPWME